MTKAVLQNQKISLSYIVQKINFKVINFSSLLLILNYKQNQQTWKN